MEAMSLEAVFGERLRGVPISSNKSMIGHTLTAAGAIEAVFSVKTMQSGVIPPTINYKVPDPSITLDVVPNVARASRRSARCSPTPSASAARTPAWSSPPSRRRARARRPADTSAMRALQLLDSRTLAVVDLPDPPPPGPRRGAGQDRRGRPQPHRRLGLARHGLRQAEAADRRRRRGGGDDRRARARASATASVGDIVAIFGAETCGTCEACRAGRDNLCVNVARHPRLPHRRPGPRARSTSPRASRFRRRGRRRSRRRPARRSPSARRSTCCSTTPSSRPARPSSSRPAAAASAPRRSSSPRRSARR